MKAFESPFSKPELTAYFDGLSPSTQERILQSGAENRLESVEQLELLAHRIEKGKKQNPNYPISRK